MMTLEARHTSVLVAEALEALGVGPGGRWLDATVGEGGHSLAILEATGPDGRLLGLDVDPLAVSRARARLAPFGNRAVVVPRNFRHLAAIVRCQGFAPIRGILFDLGLSSLLLEESGRGFSFQKEEPLDMRFDPSQRLTAADIIDTYSEEELASLLWRYGEERRSRRIARALVARRPMATTGQLVAAALSALGGREGRLHPATRVFQALRIAVNNELGNLGEALEQAVGLLEPGGRLAVIAYHSLEDRLVKEFFSRESRDCICPPETPVCRCGHRATLKPAGRLLRPTAAEISRNPRSRSARLRVAQRLGENGNGSQVRPMCASLTVTSDHIF